MSRMNVREYVQDVLVVAERQKLSLTLGLRAKLVPVYWRRWCVVACLASAGTYRGEKPMRGSALGTLNLPLRLFSWRAPLTPAAQRIYSGPADFWCSSGLSRSGSFGFLPHPTFRFVVRQVPDGYKVVHCSLAPPVFNLASQAGELPS